MADQLESGTVTTPVIEGGSTTDERGPPIQVTGPSDVEEHRGIIALVLVVLLGVVVGGHYVCMLVLEWNGRKSDGIVNAFNAALPVISGLAGSAVTYYFTRRDKPE